MREFDHEDGLSRRKLLECMTWTGTGVLWTLTGGVPRSLGLIDKAISRGGTRPDIFANQRQPRRL